MSQLGRFPFLENPEEKSAKSLSKNASQKILNVHRGTELQRGEIVFIDAGRKHRENTQ